MSLQQQRIAALCDELKLSAVSAEWSALAQRAADTQASFADFLTSLLETEQAAKTERTRQALLKLATLPVVKTIESYDFNFATGAPKLQRTWCCSDLRALARAIWRWPSAIA